LALAALRAKLLTMTTGARAKTTKRLGICVLRSS
jgi:hypothetical protein